MSELNGSALSVKSIMEKIRKEVIVRRAENASIVTSSHNRESESTAIKSLHIISENQFAIKEQYDLADFCQYNDVEFIDSVFKGLLKRAPDECGMQSRLLQLRSGKLSKSEILAMVRFSKEGRRKSVKVAGIRFRYCQAIAYRVPVLGNVVKFMYVLLTLPKLLTRLNESENHFSAQIKMGENNDLLLQGLIHQKADLAALDSKADR
ncbi:MAG TPA: hypothetical protein DCE52_02355, partial [Rhodobacteraceae bacterium]|nr:hypothetical protein [Paracoccaceae bacterium]